jgi:hypothetical protein
MINREMEQKSVHRLRPMPMAICLALGRILAVEKWERDQPAQRAALMLF